MLCVALQELLADAFLSFASHLGAGVIVVQKMKVWGEGMGWMWMELEC